MAFFENNDSEKALLRALGSGRGAEELLIASLGGRAQRPEAFENSRRQFREKQAQREFSNYIAELCNQVIDGKITKIQAGDKLRAEAARIVRNKPDYSQWVTDLVEKGIGQINAVREPVSACEPYKGNTPISNSIIKNYYEGAKRNMSEPNGGNIYNFGPNSQINQNLGSGTLTATQNNGPNMAELQTLINYITEKLKEQGLSEGQIASIGPEITEVAVECDKEEVNKGKLQSVFSKIKEKAGQFAFDFISKVASEIIIKKLDR